MHNPKFKVGELIILSEDNYFLEKKWFFDQNYMNKTIRIENYIFVGRDTKCIILNVYYCTFAIYEILVLCNDFICKILYTFNYYLERTAKILQ